MKCGAIFFLFLGSCIEKEGGVMGHKLDEYEAQSKILSLDSSPWGFSRKQ